MFNYCFNLTLLIIINDKENHLSYLPNPDTNIGKIYSLLLSSEYWSYKVLKKEIQKKYPQMPTGTIHVHLNFLLEKNVIKKKIIDNIACYKKIGGEIKNNNKTRQGLQNGTSIKILDFLKSQIGKKVSASIIKSELDIQSTIPHDVLRRLSNSGYIQEISHTNPKAFLVLPDIKTLDHLPYKNEKSNPSVITKNTVEVIKPEGDIQDLTIGQIINEFIKLKQENQHLKDALRRIAGELTSIIDIE